MSMMIAGTIASAVLGFVGAAAQSSQANAAYQAQVEASNQQLALIYEENERLRGEVDEQALEAKSDRVRALNHELGALRATREFGLTGNALTRMMVQSSYTAGLDLSRIESNRKAEQGAITAAYDRRKLAPASRQNPTDPNIPGQTLRWAACIAPIASQPGGSTTSTQVVQ